MKDSYSIFHELYKLHFSLIFRYIFYFLLLVFLIHILIEWRRFISKVNKLPMQKLKFYHILGHVHYVYQNTRVKNDISRHVYEFMLLEALHKQISNECLYAIWVVCWPTIHIHKAEAVEAILTNTLELKKPWHYKYLHPWLGEGLLNSYGEKWRNRRKLLTPAFHFNILKDFLTVFNKQASILVQVLDRHALDDYIDIVPFITRCSLDIVCETILGVKIHTQTEPTNPYAESVATIKTSLSKRLFNPHLWSGLIFKMNAVGKTFYKHIGVVHDFANKIIQEKKQKLLSLTENSQTAEGKENKFIPRRKAFLDLLLDEHINNNSISEKEIREEVDTFTFEGHDTTASAMSWSLYLIGLHAGVQEKIHKELDDIFGPDDREVTMNDLKEMKYLECVIKESMRLYPPVPFFGREIHQDIKIKNFTIPKGCNVFLDVYFLHRDPDVFPNPEKFVPERFSSEQNGDRNNFAYIPFSAGSRNCIGQRFAMMEVKTVISTILRKFKIRSLDPRDRIHAMAEMVLMPAESLRIEIRPRNYVPAELPKYFYFP